MCSMGICSVFAEVVSVFRRYLSQFCVLPIVAVGHRGDSTLAIGGFKSTLFELHIGVRGTLLIFFKKKMFGDAIKMEQKSPFKKQKIKRSRAEAHLF